MDPAPAASSQASCAKVCVPKVLVQRVCAIIVQVLVPLVMPGMG